MVIYFF